MRYLLIEDSAEVAVPILRYFQAKGYAIDHADTIKLAKASLQVQEYDAVILDLNMPDGNGMDLLVQLRRERNQHPPVLVLSVNHAVDTRLKSFESGANDYLLKPFDLRELDARLRNLLTPPVGATGRVLRLGELELDFHERQITFRGELLQLSPKDFTLLEVLLVNANRPVSKSMLQDKLYGFGDGAVSPNAIELRIARIRKKLQPTGVGIKALWGIGYQIKLDD